MRSQRSIASAAGAFAGLALALALRQGPGADISRDRAIRRSVRGRAASTRYPPSSPPAAGCSMRRVWDQVARQAQPILGPWWSTDVQLEDATRRGVSTFAGMLERGEPFRDMLEIAF